MQRGVLVSVCRLPWPGLPKLDLLMWRMVCPGLGRCCWCCCCCCLQVLPRCNPDGTLSARGGLILRAGDSEADGPLMGEKVLVDNAWPGLPLGTLPSLAVLDFCVLWHIMSRGTPSQCRGEAGLCWRIGEVVVAIALKTPNGTCCGAPTPLWWPGQRAFTGSSDIPAAACVAWPLGLCSLIFAWNSGLVWSKCAHC